MSQTVSSNQLNNIQEYKTTTVVAPTFSSADIQKVTELFSLLIKIDERIKKQSAKSEDSKLTK